MTQTAKDKDDLLIRISDLELDLKYSQEELRELETENKELEEKVEELEEKIKSANGWLDKISDIARNRA